MYYLVQPLNPTYFISLTLKKHIRMSPLHDTHKFSQFSGELSLSYKRKLILVYHIYIAGCNRANHEIEYPQKGRHSTCNGNLEINEVNEGEYTRKLQL